MIIAFLYSSVKYYSGSWKAWIYKKPPANAGRFIVFEWLDKRHFSFLCLRLIYLGSNVTLIYIWTKSVRPNTKIYHSKSFLLESVDNTTQKREKGKKSKSPRLITQDMLIYIHVTQDISSDY